jgi:hypothetical protein
VSGLGFGGRRAAGGSHAWWTGYQVFRTEPNRDGVGGRLRALSRVDSGTFGFRKRESGQKTEFKSRRRDGPKERKRRMKRHQASIIRPRQ